MVDDTECALQEGEKKYAMLQKNGVVIAVSHKSKGFLYEGYSYKEFIEQGFEEFKIGGQTNSFIISAASHSEAIEKAECWRKKRIGELKKELASLEEGVILPLHVYGKW